MEHRKSIFLPSIIPVRHPDETELTATVRALPVLRSAQALADWVGDTPIDVAVGWRSPEAQLDVARTLGLISDDGTMTPEISGRLNWLYEVAFHAGYVHTHDGIMHRNEELRDSPDRADDEIVRDWGGALDALIAHGVEEAVPRDVSSAPFDFHGIGSFPLLKLLELHGTAPVEVLSADIFDTVAAELMPSAARLHWAEWTAKHGDPVHVFLRLAEELGVVTVDSATVTLTPLGTWALIGQLNGAQTEQLPPSAELTGKQVIICRLGMSDEAFGRELAGWLAARTPDSAVRELLTTADDREPGYLTTGVRIAASIPGDTDSAWRAAMELRSVRPYAVAELNRRAGRDPRRDPLPGLEPLDCDAVVMASNAIIAAYALGRGPEALAEAVRQAAIPASRDVLFEDMWRSRHVIAEQALSVVGKYHPDKKTAKAARTALRKTMSARSAPRPR